MKEKKVALFLTLIALLALVLGACNPEPQIETVEVQVVETVEVEEISKLRRQLREEIIAKVQSQNPNYVRSP